MAGFGSHRCVRARIVERWVFNFRLSPESAEALLPVPWLSPVLVDGSAVFSFCPYLIADVRIGHGPRLVRAHARPMFFSAGRLSVTDARDFSARTVAWVPGRESGRTLAVAIASRLLGAPFRRVSVSISAAAPPVADTTADDEAARRLEVGEPDGGLRFGATIGSVEALSDTRSDSLFASATDFERFFACSSSWAPSSRPGALKRLDLDAFGTRWGRVGATSITGSEVPQGAVFDSAFVGVGGEYRWTPVGTSRRLGERAGEHRPIVVASCNLRPVAEVDSPPP